MNVLLLCLYRVIIVVLVTIMLDLDRVGAVVVEVDMVVSLGPTV